MELLLKRVHGNPGDPFALFADGVLLPRQVCTSLISEAGELPRLVVTFVVDGEAVRIEGAQSDEGGGG